MSSWSEDLFQELTRLTRQHAFNWERVSQDLNCYVEGRTGGSNSILTFQINPQTCREVFARGNVVVIPPEVIEREGRRLKPDTNEDLSIEQIMERVEQSELDLMHRKEEIFQRVLDSLGGEGSEGAQRIHDTATSAYLEAKRLRDESKLRQQQKKADREEKQRLAQEREKLRRRFDEDSEDAKGDYSFLTQSDAKDEATIDAYEEKMMSNTSINLEDVFGGSNIDALLTELEAEFALQAMGKDDEQSPELERLYKLLDEAAAEPVPKRVRNPSYSTSTNYRSTAYESFILESTASASTLPAPPSKAVVRGSAESGNGKAGTGSTISLSLPHEKIAAPAPPAATTTARATQRGRSEYQAAITEAESQQQDEEDDSDEDLFFASRRKMKRASAIAEETLRRTQPVLPATVPPPTADTAPAASYEENDEEVKDDNYIDSRNRNKQRADIPPLQQQATKALPPSTNEEEAEKEEEGLAPAPEPESRQPKPSPSYAIATPVKKQQDDVVATVTTTPEVVAAIEEEAPREDMTVVSGGLLSGSLSSSSSTNRKPLKGKVAMVMKTRPKASNENTAATDDAAAFAVKEVIVPSQPFVSAASSSSTTMSANRAAEEGSQTISATAIVDDEQRPDEQQQETVAEVSLPSINNCHSILPSLPYSTLLYTSQVFSTFAGEIQQETQETYCEVEDMIIAIITIDSHKHGDCLSFELLQLLIDHSDRTWSCVGCHRAIRQEEPEKGHGKVEFLFVFHCPRESIFIAATQYWLETTKLRLSDNTTQNSTFVSQDDEKSSFEGEEKSMVLSSFMQIYEGSSAFLPRLSSLHNVIPSPKVEFFLHDQNFVRDFRISQMAALIIKPHAFDKLSVIIRHIEKCGLRLVGTRLLHLPAALYAEAKALTTVDLVATSAEADAKVWCFALISSHPSANAAEILRTIIGPEDVNLARQTDPTSLRALLGGKAGKVENVCYNVGYATESVSRELAYWFGPHTSALPDRSVSLLSVPSDQTLIFGIKLSQSQQKQRLTLLQIKTIQAKLLDLFTIDFQSHAKIVTLKTLSTEEYSSRLHTFKQQNLASLHRQKSPSDGANKSALQCWYVEYTTHASTVYHEKMWDHLLACIDRLLDGFGAAGLVASYFQATTVDGVDSDSAAVQSDGKKPQPEQQMVGSQYSALQALSKVSPADYRSHEDLGLPDTIILHLPRNELILLPTLLSKLSKDTHVLGVSSSGGPDVMVVVRGLQIIETIDNAIVQVTSSTSPLPAYNRKQYYANNSPPKPVASKITVIKGRKALEKIFIEFALSSLYLQPAIRDLRRYIPNAHQFLHLFSQGVENGGKGTDAISSIGDEESSTVSSVGIAHALFPPGQFTAIAAVVIPWFTTISSHNNSVSDAEGLIYMRRLTKTASRLVKEGFHLLALQYHAQVDFTTLRLLYEEQLEAFAAGSSSSEQTLFATGMNNDGQFFPVMILLVSRQSALLKLKTSIGPVYEENVAMEQYPRSVSALLFSLHPTSKLINNNDSKVTARWAKSAAVIDDQDASRSALPYLLPTLTVISAEHVVRRYLPHFLRLFTEMQKAEVWSLDHHHHLQQDQTVEDEDGRGWLDMAEGFFEMDTALKDRLQPHPPPPLPPSSSISVSTTAATTATTAVSVVTEEGPQGLAITSRLLRHRGLNTILEALLAEQLQVIQACTSHISTAMMAKVLSEAAGQSSLTLRPSLQALQNGPVLLLGLRGPSHAFVRLKSLPAYGERSSSVSIWQMPAVVAGSGRSETEAGMTENGVLASSSTRLGGVDPNIEQKLDSRLEEIMERNLIADKAHAGLKPISDTDKDQIKNFVPLRNPRVDSQTHQKSKQRK